VEAVEEAMRHVEAHGGGEGLSRSSAVAEQS